MEIANKLRKLISLSSEIPEEKINDLFQELFEKYPDGEDPWGPQS